jgi:hypothetical protein
MLLLSAAFLFSPVDANAAQENVLPVCKTLKNEKLQTFTLPKSDDPENFSSVTSDIFDCSEIDGEESATPTKEEACKLAENLIKKLALEAPDAALGAAAKTRMQKMLAKNPQGTI